MPLQPTKIALKQKGKERPWRLISMFAAKGAFGVNNLIKDSFIAINAYCMNINS